jgi:hypothetical protein
MTPFNLQEFLESIKPNNLRQNRSHRHNPHSRIFTHKYADSRQKNGLGDLLRKRKGSHFVKPQPSAKARRRLEKEGQS